MRLGNSRLGGDASGGVEFPLIPPALALSIPVLVTCTRISMDVWEDDNSTITTTTKDIGSPISANKHFKWN